MKFQAAAPDELLAAMYLEGETPLACLAQESLALFQAFRSHAPLPANQVLARWQQPFVGPEDTLAAVGTRLTEEDEAAISSLGTATALACVFKLALVLAAAQHNLLPAKEIPRRLFPATPNGETHPNPVAFETEMTRRLSPDIFGDEIFSWWHRTASVVAVQPIFRRFAAAYGEVAHLLNSIDVAGLEGDWPGDLYFQCFQARSRKTLGEFYTPSPIVEFILEAVGYTPAAGLVQKRLLDPACGSGSFLVAALRRWHDAATHEAAIRGWPALLQDLCTVPRIGGFDLHPLACLMARVRFLMMLLPSWARARREASSDFFLPRLPIYRTNALEEKEEVERFLTQQDRSSTAQLALFEGEIRENRLDYSAQLEDPGKQANTLDFVVGNPPYLRIQQVQPVWRRAYYAHRYVAATGRYDLYILFIEQGLRWLKPGGKLGYICSNKFLTSNSGRGLRRLISEQAQLEYLVDLGDTKLFEAAVLPCVMVLRKDTSLTRSTFPYVALRRCPVINAGDHPVDSPVPSADDLFAELSCRNEPREKHLHVVNDPHGPIPIHLRVFPTQQPDNDDFWHFMPESEEAVIDKIEQAATVHLGDWARKIITGIKSTAAGVFADLLTAEFTTAQGLESDLLHPAIRGSNVRRWRITWTGRTPKTDTYVLYPHLKENGRVIPVDLTAYPGVARYLKQHRQVLERRDYLLQAGRQWYELWVHQDPDDLGAVPKIVTPDLADRNSFSLDEVGYFPIESCFAILLPDATLDDYYFLLGLLNSEVLEFYHKRRTSTFIYAGRFRYWTSYMERYPLVRCGPEQQAVRQAIVNCVQTLLHSGEDGDHSAVEQALNQWVAQLYGLSAKDQETMRAFLSTTRS